MQIRSKYGSYYSLAVLVTLLLALLATGCTGTQVGTGVKIGVINKTGVETAMGEVIRLDCAKHSKEGAVPGCTRKINDADWDRAAKAYGVYEAAQKSYADGLVAWTRVKSATNDQKLTVATDQLKAQAENAAKILCSFKGSSENLATLCTSMGVQ